MSITPQQPATEAAIKFMDNDSEATVDSRGKMVIESDDRHAMQVAANQKIIDDLEMPFEDRLAAVMANNKMRSIAAKYPEQLIEMNKTLGPTIAEKIMTEQNTNHFVKTAKALVNGSSEELSVLNEQANKHEHLEGSREAIKRRNLLNSLTS